MKGWGVIGKEVCWGDRVCGWSSWMMEHNKKIKY